MQTNLLIALCLIAAALGCTRTGQNFTLKKLPSGKEIRVTDVRKLDFPNRDSALVMNYQTDISIDDKAALRAEVDEIWSVFQKEVEDAHLTVGVVRATHLEGGGLIQSGNGYGFVFRKQADGQWHALADEKGAK